jgi:hypothetical protein
MLAHVYHDSVMIDSRQDAFVEHVGAETVALQNTSERIHSFDFHVPLEPAADQPHA